MSDRHSGYIVTLERDLRADDAEAIMQAIQMIRGVLSVTAVVWDINTHIAEQRAQNAYRQKLLRLLEEPEAPEVAG
jgi:hypothetical protein